MTHRLRPCELGVEKPSKRCSNSNHNLIKNLASAQTACVEEPDLQALRQSVSNHVTFAAVVLVPLPPGNKLDDTSKGKFTDVCLRVSCLEYFRLDEWTWRQPPNRLDSSSSCETHRRPRASTG